MFFKKLKSLIAIFIVATFIMPQGVLAYSKYIIAGGENIGLHINNNGVIVAGFYKINNVYPGINANLKKGDTIIKVDDNEIKNIDDLINSIKNSNQKDLKIVYLRNNNKKTATLNLVNDNNVLKTGLYIKDMVSGIGTLTFIDPNTKLYGALGHEVIETSSGVMIEVKDGKIYNSNVTSIDKSVRGEPGSKNANINSNDVYGDIKENTNMGVFGNYTKEINKTKLYKVAEPSEIKKEEAKIITVLNGEEKKEYKINILDINNEKNSNKNILFEVTDEELIKKTGGIIQGMSGSPIIQDGKLIGAVTHVFVNDPTKGYGIFAENMYYSS